MSLKLAELFRKSKPYFFLFIILLISYLPLSTLHFSIKNDAFTDNFPNKYFLSQSLHAHVFPLWNPYMNFGFPIYQDYGFAFWNPVTWFFALIGYNAYTLTLEILLYIYIAGVAMFLLARFLKLSINISLAVASMYMCCGFFISHIQHINFLMAAAVMPLLLKHFFKILFEPTFINSVFASIFGWLICISGHPALPFGTVYFFLILFILMMMFNAGLRKNFKAICIYLMIAGFFLLLLLSPLIYSYSNIISQYLRYSVINPGSSLPGFFDLRALISLVLPFSTVAHSNFFLNDVSCRNIYFSIAGVIFIFFGFKGYRKISMPLVITAGFMLFFSLGEPFKHILFDKLPLFRFVRTNGEYIIFSILCFCCIAGFGLENISRNLNKSKLAVRNFFLITGLISFVIACFILIFNCSNFFNIFKDAVSENPVSFIKDFLAALTFKTALFINLVLLIFISLAFILKKNYTTKFFLLIITADLIINSFLYLPVTGVGTTTVQQVQSIYNSNPRGIPVPELIAINKIDTLDAKTTGLVGDITYYNKKIGTTKLTNYPSYFASTDSFFKSSYKKFILTKPYIFLLSGNKNFYVKKFSPQNIIINISSNKNDTLVLLQNDYKFWKAFNNNKPAIIKKSFLTFMSVPVNKGVNKVEFIYKDNNLIYFSLISFSTLIFIVVIVFKEFKKRRYTHASTTSVLLT